MSILADIELDNLVIEILTKLKKFDSKNDFDSNVVDPFAATKKAPVGMYIIVTAIFAIASAAAQLSVLY